MKSSVVAVLLLLLALASAACGGNSDSTTAPAGPTLTGTSELFTGILSVQGSSFYSFTVTAAETVSVSLTSLEASTTSPASTLVVRLGLGVPVGTDCTINTTVDTAAGLTTQLTAPLNPDTYCVKLSDIGNLTVPMTFTVRIGHNVGVTGPTATPLTETFSSFLTPMGSSAHTFQVSQNGTISVSLTSVTPSSAVGLGIGVPGAGTAVCLITTSQNVTAGATLAIAVDAGTYCAEVYDPGTLSLPGVAFSMTITHP